MADWNIGIDFNNLFVGYGEPSSARTIPRTWTRKPEWRRSRPRWISTYSGIFLLTAGLVLNLGLGEGVLW